MSPSISQKSLLNRYLFSDLGDSQRAQDGDSESQHGSDSEEILSEADHAIQLELELIEQRFYDYNQAPLNLSLLVFPEPTLNPTTGLEYAASNIDKVLDQFPAALLATKQ